MTTLDMDAVLTAIPTLDENDLYRILWAAQEAIEKDIDRNLPGVVIDAYKEAVPGGRLPDRIEFRTSEWDNGYFWYADEATCHYSDGTTETVDLSGAEDELSDHAGAHASLTWNNKLIIETATGKVIFD